MVSKQYKEFARALMDELTESEETIAKLKDSVSHLESQLRLAKEIMSKASGGEIHVGIWGRDCDMVESTSLTTIPATLDDYERLDESVHKNAEGPYSITILTHDEAQRFKPEVRDRALEAFEDGHQHIIY